MADYQDCYFANSSDLQQYYRDYGSPFDGAEIMLCLPGLTRNSRDFSHVADQFCDRFRVIAVEQRGRGHSAYDPDSSRYQPLTYVQDMFTLMAHLGTEAVHVCATSLGGLMTVLMQATKPGCILSAIINDIGPEIDPKGIERIQTYVGTTPDLHTWEDAVNLMKAGASDVYPDFTDAQWEDFTARLYVMKDGKPVADYDPRISEPFNSAPDTAAPDLWPFWAAMAAVPTFVLRGETSDILAADTLLKMAEGHSDFKTLTVPRVGHAPAMDEPMVVEAFEDWGNRFTKRA